MPMSQRRCARLVALIVVATALVAGPPATGAESDAARVVGRDAQRLPDGHYLVALNDGRTLVTHGGDPADTMGDHGTGMGPGDPERDPVCATDYYQHVLYGYPTGSSNRYSSVLAQIRSAVKRMNAVLDEEAISSGNKHADFKVKCDPGGVIAVGQFSAAASDFTTIVNAASAAGYNASNADYTIFWDSNLSGYCGVGSYIRNDTPGATNPNNNGGGYGVSYSSCWDGRTPMHENGHNQGAVQRYAPDSTGLGGHCNDLYDVLCYAPDGGDQNQTEILTCTDRMHYDCGNDSYFDAETEAGEWLATHWNIGSTANRFIAFSSLDPQPAASVSPSSHAFGNQTTGVTSAPRTVTVTSNGQLDLVVGTATLTGANASDFAIASDTCSGQTIAPGGTCALTVTFTPAASGAKAATLSIPHNAPSSPSAVALTGTGVTPAPGVSLNPSSLSFGSRTVGTSAPMQRSIVTNSGTAPLIVGAVTRTGTGAAQFSIQADTCSSQTLAPGGTCLLDAVFAPTAEGSFTAALSIPSNASGSPHAVAMTGTGVAPGPAITFTPSSLVFGNVENGKTATRGVTITNTGTAGLDVSSLSIVGSAAFSVASQTCTAGTIAVGSSCSVSVVFAPTSNGAVSAALRVTSNAPGSPHSVPLSGTGAPPVSFAPPALNFGVVEAGTFSAESMVTLTNNSATSPLSITSIHVTGAFASAFSISTPGCTGTIAAGSSCTVGLRFRPGAAGGHVASLQFNSTPVLSYSLSGSGIDTLAPESTFTTGSGSILLINHGITFLTNNKVTGYSQDLGTAIQKVVVVFTHQATGVQTTRTLTGSQLACEVPQSCAWQAIVPNTPGIYRVNVQASDSAAPQNTETPGPQISVYAV